MIEIPEIKARVGEDELNLSLGGVRAYNLENLYNKKSPERFKLFIGFKNQVCTNLCISTDGYGDDVKVQTVQELQERAIELFSYYNHEQESLRFKELDNVWLNSNQMTHFIGRAKEYLCLDNIERIDKPYFPLGDSQLSALVKEYTSASESGKLDDITLWTLYNLMTSANKSSYIDSFLERNTKCLDLVKSMGNSINKGYPHWFVDNLIITKNGN